MPKISVIVPVYNVEPYLNRCIDSILNQTYKELELILIDDGSPDNCPTICEEAARRDSRVKVIHKKNGGVSSARNAGLDAATGEYIAFVDGDDTIAECFIDVLFHACIKNSADVAYCNFVRIDANTQDRRESYGMKDVVCDVCTGKECVDLFFEKWCQPNIVNKLIKKDLTVGLRFPDAVKAEDLWFSYHILQRANRVAGLKHCNMYHYWVNENGAMSQVKPKHAADELQMRLEIYNTLLNGRYPVSRKFASQTMRNYLDYCLCARAGFGELNQVLADYGRVLVKEMWIPLANKLNEKWDLSILRFSHRLWTLKRLAEYKILGKPLYLE